ncbi:hypothetical protein M3210_14520 [Oceanobacillus luteolus]|uniref:hypothetical protein n=1 Tax=Oceanobacillus luteolus TaxID=1274358 RepID=UPI00203E50B5|nr:hypothetical protein [Oceanobacillus luteolus]MCM3741485.1 hypothetical protein [Oceanobacillus luteolus]
MDSFKKIHLLSQELIPLINDLEEEPKQIILEHIKDCGDCRKLHESAVEFDESMPKQDFSEDVELKPLKKLVQFNTGLKLLLVTVRALILFYIFYSSFSFYGESAPLLMGQFYSGIILFYVPAAIFLLVFTFTFFNKKWFWTSLVADLVIIFLLDNIVELFL